MKRTSRLPAPPHSLTCRMLTRSSKKSTLMDKDLKSGIIWLHGPHHWVYTSTTATHTHTHTYSMASINHQDRGHTHNTCTHCTQPQKQLPGSLCSLGSSFEKTMDLNVSSSDTLLTIFGGILEDVCVPELVYQHKMP